MQVSFFEQIESTNHHENSWFPFYFAQFLFHCLRYSIASLFMDQRVLNVVIYTSLQSDPKLAQVSLLRVSLSIMCKYRKAKLKSARSFWIMVRLKIQFRWCAAPQSSTKKAQRSCGEPLPNFESFRDDIMKYCRCSWRCWTTYSLKISIANSVHDQVFANYM